MCKMYSREIDKLLLRIQESSLIIKFITLQELVELRRERER